MRCRPVSNPRVLDQGTDRSTVKGTLRVAAGKEFISGRMVLETDSQTPTPPLMRTYFLPPIYLTTTTAWQQPSPGLPIIEMADRRLSERQSLLGLRFEAEKLVAQLRGLHNSSAQDLLDRAEPPGTGAVKLDTIFTQFIDKHRRIWLSAKAGQKWPDMLESIPDALDYGLAQRSRTTRESPPRRSSVDPPAPMIQPLDVVDSGLELVTELLVVGVLMRAAAAKPRRLRKFVAMFARNEIT
ncbi:hypothetical protein C8R46DRAFT_1030563 [Mycena filopes]|nr:hypothetical protein C8R46DRAFT_1030563 [Mycena filopes]